MLRSSHSVTQLRRLLAVNFGRNVEEKWLFCSAVNRESRRTGWTASHSFIYLVVFQPSSPSQLPPPITRRLFISRVKHVGDCRRVQWITGRPAACKPSEWCAAESHLPMSSWNGMFTHVRFAVCRGKGTSFTQRTPTRRLQSSQTSDMTWEGLNEFSIYCCRIGLRISAWAPHLPPSVSLYRISLSGLSTRQSHR